MEVAAAPLAAPGGEVEVRDRFRSILWKHLGGDTRYSAINAALDEMLAALSTTAEPSPTPASVEEERERDIERVARAICKTKNVSPDTLYQHNFEGDYPEDERREYPDPFTGEPRVQLFHRAWRHSVPAAEAAIAAIRISVEEERERCARVAEHYAQCDADHGFADQAARMREIAAAIRTGERA